VKEKCFKFLNQEKEKVFYFDKKKKLGKEKLIKLLL